MVQRSIVAVFVDASRFEAQVGHGSCDKQLRVHGWDFRDRGFQVNGTWSAGTKDVWRRFARIKKFLARRPKPLSKREIAGRGSRSRGVASAFLGIGGRTFSGAPKLRLNGVHRSKVTGQLQKVNRRKMEIQSWNIGDKSA